MTVQKPLVSFTMSYFRPKSTCTFWASGAFTRNTTRLSGKIWGYFAFLTFVEAGVPRTVYLVNEATSTGLNRNCENMYRPFFQTLKSCPPGSMSVADEFPCRMLYEA